MKLFIMVIALVFAVGIILVGFAFGFSFLLFKLFGKLSGLDRLAAVYPADRVPEEGIHRKQRIAVGSVYYRNTAEIGVKAHGLYLWVRPFLSKYKPLFIPWRELSNPQPTVLALRRAVRLIVGNPQVTTIVITSQLFDKMRQYLSKEP